MVSKTKYATASQFWPKTQTSTSAVFCYLPRCQNVSLEFSDIEHGHLFSWQSNKKGKFVKCVCDKCSKYSEKSSEKNSETYSVENRNKFLGYNCLVSGSSSSLWRSGSWSSFLKSRSWSSWSSSSFFNYHLCKGLSKTADQAWGQLHHSFYSKFSSKFFLKLS